MQKLLKPKFETAVIGVPPPPPREELKISSTGLNPPREKEGGEEVLDCGTEGTEQHLFHMNYRELR